MAKQKLKTYTVGAFIKVWADLEIEAASYQDAFERSKALVVTDFVTFEGGYNDGNMKVVQVYDNDFDTEIK